MRIERTDLRGERLLLHVEGQTEETFVNDVLAPHLYARAMARCGPGSWGTRASATGAAASVTGTQCAATLPINSGKTGVVCHDDGGLLRASAEWAEGMARTSSRVDAPVCQEGGRCGSGAPGGHPP